MSDTPEQRHSVLDFLRSKKAVIGSIAALALTTSGCIDLFAKSNQSPSTSNTVATDRFHSLTSSCSPNMQPDDVEAAVECLAVLEHADIALVNYDLSEKLAQTLAKRAQQVMKKVAADQVNLSIKVVTPNKEAKDIFASTTSSNSDHCIDASTVRNYSGYIGASTMNGLAAYDKIIGVTNHEPCTHDMGGVASPEFGWRYAEVFGIKAVTKENQIKRTSYGSYIVNRYSATSVLNHEIFHGLELGHAGTIVSKKRADSFINVFKPKTDLAKWLANPQYDEYGDYGNIMGSQSADTSRMKLNIIQKHMLEAPRRILNQPVKIVDWKLSDQPFTLTAQNMKTTYLSTPLAKSIPVTDINGNKTMFDTLNITAEPYLYPGATSNELDYITFYVTSKNGHNDTAEIGKIYTNASEKTKVYRLKNGASTIRVTIPKGKLAQAIVTFDE